MKHLTFKKIKIARINNQHAIFGGDGKRTIVQGCLPDTITCPFDKTKEPYSGCCGTNESTKTLGGFANTNDNNCDG